MEVLFGLILIVLVAAFVLAPLRGPRHPARGEDPLIADLEARKEAKYREVRDTQLDHASGKLGEEDFRAQEARLRGEAAEILRELDAARKGGGERSEAAPGPPGTGRAAPRDPSDAPTPAPRDPSDAPTPAPRDPSDTPTP
ncbi:MAG: hypothetical protein U0R52_08430 [Solirubrobacterales bacterium]